MATPIPKNHAAFSLEEILAATGGELITRGELGEGVSSVSTDTRTLDAGAAFLALVGVAFDGHDHLEAARSRGAALAIVERDVPAPAEMAVVRVGSTLEALGDLGRAHARRWRKLGGDRRIVAITGSAGKTTTRVATSALCEELWPGKVHGAAGNLNNRVGVPMVLLGLGPEHTIAVVEMGMNEPGEIAELCRIAEPEVGVVTLIAAAHTEGLGSIEGVAEEKGALFRALSAAGVAIGNGDDARVRREMERTPAQRRVLYGRADDAEIRISARKPTSLTRAWVEITRRGRGALAFETPLMGEAGALASAAAIAAVEIGLGVELEASTCARAFVRAEVGAGAGRLAPRMCPGDVAVVDDSYNANPASMCASIRASAELAELSRRKLVLVLGEMRELGSLSAEGHDEVGRVAAVSDARLVVTVGPEAKRIADRVSEASVRALSFERTESALARVCAEVRQGDLVLIKGSRSIGTEAIVRALAEARQPSIGGAA